VSKIYNDLKIQETEDPVWYLKVSDNLVYGPVTLAALIEWAPQGRVTGGSEISQDNKTWVPAESVPQLKLDWIAESQDGAVRGPFNLKAIPLLVTRGVLDAAVVLRHRTTGERIAAQ
jgi:hypothetical protein